MKGEALCWLALARIDIRSLALLHARRREGAELLTVRGSVRIIGVADVDAGVSSIRAAYRSDTNTIGLGWFRQVGSWKRPQSSILGAGDVRYLERGGDLIIAAAFTNEADARAWLEKRHAYTLPTWEPK